MRILTEDICKHFRTKFIFQRGDEIKSPNWKNLKELSDIENWIKD